MSKVELLGEKKFQTNACNFSLTTVTTTGYGDMSAATELGRLLATSEAVIGQVFLVTLVAVLVTRFAQRAGTGED